jgi:hypothetical protein
LNCRSQGEGIIPAIAHARENLLPKKAQIIPKSATLKGILVESKTLHSLNRASIAAGFHVSTINEYATQGYFPVRLRAFDFVPLSDPFEIFYFDFNAEKINPGSKMICVPAIQDGIGHAFIFWFKMQLDDELFISTQPGAITHWSQALQCLDKQVAIRSGKSLQVFAEHNCSQIPLRLVEAG